MLRKKLAGLRRHRGKILGAGLVATGALAALHRRRPLKTPQRTRGISSPKTPTRGITKTPQGERVSPPMIEIVHNTPINILHRHGRPLARLRNKDEFL